MGDFFRGWRRKIGLMLLLAAGGILGLWIRSHSVNDVLSIPTGEDDAQVFVSDRSGLIWLRMHFLVRQIEPASLPYYQRQPVTKSGLLNEFLFTKWTFQKAGFQFGSGEEHQPGWGGSAGGRAEGVGGIVDMMLPMEPKFRATSIVVIPSWFVVLLLTILAGILIFRRNPAVGVASPSRQMASTQVDGKS